MPQFNLQLSWKQKLSIVILITLIGLGVVAVSAFMGLNSVNDGFTKQSVANEYEKNSLSLTISLLELEAATKNLNSDSVQKLTQDLNDLHKFAEQMKVQAIALGYEELENFSDELTELTAQYISLRKEWLNISSILGFATDEGKLAALVIASEDVKKIGFSMINEPVNALSFNQGKYLVDQDSGSEQALEEVLIELETTVKTMEWQDSKIGQTISNYRSAFDEAKVLISKASEINAALAPISDNLAKMVQEQKAFLTESVLTQVSAEADDAREAALQIIISAGFVVGAIMFLSLAANARQLNIQLRAMQVFLKKMAEGDLSERLETNNNQRDEFTQLRLASNNMITDISEVISEVVDGNKSLLILREELEQAVEELGASSNEVEEKTQQSTLATQQISVAVNDVAKRSVGVCETAQAATMSAKAGGKVIGDCVNSMTSIVCLIEKTHEEVTNLAQSSSKMLGIIDVINGLADQTNLLALNAAIESARAGEAGRGFSVVADEVRALAQKTVSATSSIGDIIKGVNNQTKRMGDLMEEGVKLASSGQENAHNAITSIESIEASIQMVETAMDQVVVAVEQISYNANDIAGQVEHICHQSTRTKETRLTMEEQTRQLSLQVESLGRLTTRFKLK